MKHAKSAKNRFPSLLIASSENKERNNNKLHNVSIEVTFKKLNS